MPRDIPKLQIYETIESFSILNFFPMKNRKDVNNKVKGMAVSIGFRDKKHQVQSSKSCMGIPPEIVCHLSQNNEATDY